MKYIHFISIANYFFVGLKNKILMAKFLRLQVQLEFQTTNFRSNA